MIKLWIDKIDGYQYDLKDEFGHRYELNLEFYGLRQSIKLNDYLLIQQDLLKENMLCFEVIEDISSIVEENSEYATLMIDNQKIYLRRVYG